MEEKTIYFLFTDTGTCLSRMINFCTNQSLNHVSISFDPELKEVYSFGRKRPRNPFVGGFIQEDPQSDFMRNANCAIYSYTVSESDCAIINHHIKEIEAEKEAYKFNFIGLLGVLFQIKISRRNALFCSQFVATVLRDLEHFQLPNPACFTTPADIRAHEGMQLIYQGKLSHYFVDTERKLTQGEQALQKQSFILLLSAKVKQFVIR
ncbi:hypothetical protein KFZ56_17705 [Virgibacillus sp. NKC19-3]|uniref:hypothetical protein n=1 Tax=Virgibacillus saliphilus TaxID=2831674 RepID=UPI001C9AA5F1|nr:hypothetical protein [Virgibacillus sp. NKC19-3]MBY7144858.1 hypothetical protein [Virgibacillus sp. NKC19-3]